MPEVTVKDPARWRCGAMRVMGDVVERRGRGKRRERRRKREEEGFTIPIEYQSSSSYC
jgi:hypothetical protein